MPASQVGQHPRTLGQHQQNLQGEIFGVVLYGRTIGMIRLYLRFRYYCIEYQSVDINNIP